MSISHPFSFPGTYGGISSLAPSLGGQTFDGVNDYMLSNPAAQYPGDSLTSTIYAAWRRTASDTRFLYGHRSFQNDLSVSGGRVTGWFRNSSAVTIWRTQTATTGFEDNELYEAIITVDNQAGTPVRNLVTGPYGSLLASNFSDIDTTDFGSGNQIAFTSGAVNTTVQIGCNVLGNNQFDGDMFFVRAWQATGDITQASVQADVRNLTGAFASPTCNYSGDDWATTGNTGSGADFTITGSLDPVYWP